MTPWVAEVYYLSIAMQQITPKASSIKQQTFFISQSLHVIKPDVVS